MLSYEDAEAEIDRFKPILAVQPLGSTEQHGPHLPISTDTIIALEVGKAIAEHFKALLLPPIPYSCSIEHREYRSTVWIRSKTLYALLNDIVKALKFHGFEALILVNGHGGNFILKTFIREVNYRFNNKPITILVDLGNMYFGSREVEDIHAGRTETSLLMYLNPKFVKGSTRGSKPKATRDLLDYSPINRFTDDGVWGSPTEASKEEGRKIFEEIVWKAVEYVEDVLRRFRPELKLKR